MNDALPLSLVLALSASACSNGERSPAPPAGVAQAPATILSAYHGLDKLPLPVVRLCPGRRSLGDDGMPVTFSVQLDADTVKAEAFAVETASGEV